MYALADVRVPPQWHTLDFISDLHLQASEPNTFNAWRAYMERTPCQALFILGDFFEVWVGDDLLDAPAPTGGFARACVQVLSAAAQRMAVYFMPGNRDFLAGTRLMRDSGMQPLADPTVLRFDQENWLLTHGDAWCTADAPYQRFRQQVRSPAWQSGFLSQPLAHRMDMARGLREASEQRKAQDHAWADVDGPTALTALQQHRACRLVHGHTHRAHDHALDAHHTRHVLSDWDASATPPRLQVLRWQRPAAHTAPAHPVRIDIKTG